MAGETEAIQITARYGQYKRVQAETVPGYKGQSKLLWHRRPVEIVSPAIPLKKGELGPWRPDPENQNVYVRGMCRRHDDVWTITLFLVNAQPQSKIRIDEAWLFQPELLVTASAGDSAPEGGAIFAKRQRTGRSGYEPALPAAGGVRRSTQRRRSRRAGPRSLGSSRGRPDRGYAHLRTAALNADDNFFSRRRPSGNEAPGRRYIGVCASGTRLKLVLIRVYVAYMAAAQKLYQEYGRYADPWMTLVGYFNSMRELGGMRRVVDDAVRTRLQKTAARGLTNRFIEPFNVEELTSLKGASDIPRILDRLETEFDPQAKRKAKGGRSRDRAKYPLDVVLATNMISVGVDVSRLGLNVTPSIH